MQVLHLKKISNVSLRSFMGEITIKGAKGDKVKVLSRNPKDCT
jgi:hypothetical protein